MNIFQSAASWPDALRLRPARLVKCPGWGGRMVLRFYGPFLKMAEPEADMALLEAVPLRELIRILADRYPALRPYAAYETDEALGAHAAFVAHGRVLKLSDPVDDSDEVNVLLPMVGG